jgi:hypothetical protein
LAVGHGIGAIKLEGAGSAPSAEAPSSLTSAGCQWGHAELAALHMNVTLPVESSKKWIFIGTVALIVLVAAGIVVLLVANSRSRRASNKHFDF